MVDPLNLEQIFVNYLAGSYTIFFFLAIAFFAYLAARLRIPNFTFLLLMGLFVVMMAGFGFQMLYAVVVFIAGLFIYQTISKIIKS